MDNEGKKGAGVPSKEEITLYLIKAELKHRKFTKGLEQIGFDVTFCSLDFSSMILSLQGLERRTDETFEWYNEVLDRFTEKVDLKNPDVNLAELAQEFLNEINRYNSVNNLKK